MKINAIKCKNCGDIIWSRARNDFHWCTCESVAIDGGFSMYQRVLGDDFEDIEIDLDVTIEEAYEDWNRHFDQLGIIHTDDNMEFVSKL